MATARDDHPASDEPLASPEDIAVAESLIQLVRTYGRARAKMLAAAQHDVEWSAQVLLKCLSGEGAMRASELAEHMRMDPSSVSRQVAALVREGLLERQADPQDGRACLLVLTDKATDVLATHDELRNRHYAAILREWSRQDVRTFARLLQRFTHDFQRATVGWPLEGTEIRQGPAEGND